MKLFNFIIGYKNSNKIICRVCLVFLCLNCFFVFFECQILKILDEKENFPLLKNFRKLESIVRKDEKKFLHFYDREIEQNSNELKNEDHYFPLNNYEENLNFVHIMEKQKIFLQTQRKKEKILIKGNKNDDSEFNKFLLKNAETKRNLFKYKNKLFKEYELDRKNEKIKMKIINSQITQYKKKLLEKVDKFIYQQNENMISTSSDVKVEDNLYAKAYQSNFNNIIAKELEQKNLIKISAKEDYIYYKNESKENSSILKDFSNIISSSNNFFSSCGENFKYCFQTKKEKSEIKSNMVI